MAASEGTQPELIRLPLVHRHLSDASVLVNILRRLSTARSLDEIMRVVTQAARALLEADGITFVLREGDLCYYAEEDAIAPLWKGRRFAMSDCISGWCMEEGKPAIIADIYQDPRIPHDAYRPTFVRSLAMVPVRQDEPIAALGAYWSEVHEATELQLEILQTLANAASLGIAFVQVQQERMKALRAVQSLDEAEAERKRFLGELRFRARSSLAMVKAIVNLTRCANGDQGEKISRRVAALMGAHQLIAQFGRQGTDIRSVLSSELQFFDGARVFLRGEAILLSPIPAEVLTIAFHELATNASEHGALSDWTGRVSVTWAADENMVAIDWVETDGPPVGQPMPGGSGIALARHLVHENGGTMRTEFGKEGVRHRISMPVDGPAA